MLLNRWSLVVVCFAGIFLPIKAQHLIYQTTNVGINSYIVYDFTTYDTDKYKSYLADDIRIPFKYVNKEFKSKSDTYELNLKKENIYDIGKVQTRMLIETSGQQMRSNDVLNDQDVQSLKLSSELKPKSYNLHSGSVIPECIIPSIPLHKTDSAYAYEVKNCPLFSNLFRHDQTNCYPLKWMIYPAYNDNDGWMAGMTLSNTHPYRIRALTWAVSPMYSFRNKKLLGQGWIQYDKANRDNESNLDYTRFRLDLKTFDMDFNEKWDYTLRYFKTDPSVQFQFRHADTTGITSALSFRCIMIFEDQPVFMKGSFIGLKNKSSFIPQLQYEWAKVHIHTQSALELKAEFQKYDQKNYLKLTATGAHRWSYLQDKNMGIRFFASGFMLNSERKTNSFQNQLVRGSIALIQHGFNDYTYDEYFLSRQNQSGFQDRQVSISQGGGFKTPVGSAHSTGMSNNYAASINLYVDAPFKASWLPLQAYFDLGLYSRYQGGRFVSNTMYNGGLALNYSDVLCIYFPFIYSEELSNIYKEVHPDFFSKISFGINFEKLNFWKNKSPKFKKNIL